MFCGPSLPPADRTAIPGVNYLPPASRDDVTKAAAEYDALLMIDGVFHHDLAPSPKEVLAACRGVRMFGASSMGALRAAECWPFGMVPLGIIARWYICEFIDGDDEVAVLVHPQTQQALTVPLVNVRYVAWLAKRAGAITGHEAEDIVAASRAVFYMDRTWEEVYGCIPQRTRAPIRRLVELGHDLKRLDARFALRSAVRHVRLAF